jgi:Mg2+ and Co2+ transporter CorA
MDGQGQLNRNDLLLMMDSYKNNVEMYTVIMEQLKKISDQLETVVEQQRDMVTKQRVTCDTIGKISETLNMTLTTQRESIKDMLADFKEGNKEALKEIIEEFKEGHQGIYKKVEGMDKDMQTSIKDYIKDQGAMKVRFNRIYAALTGVVLAAIGAVATAYGKMIDLHKVLEVVTAIATQLGVIIK